MKFLGYILVVLGAIAFVSIFFGYTHQWLMALIGLGLGRAILSDSADDFDVVATFSRTEHKSATSNIKKITERLFIPSHQRQLYDESKTTLF